ncbi:MAG: hypothetical protein ABUL62_10505 [Myxococcales bacterium]
MQLSSPSYLKHAFKDQHNLVLLLGAACFSLAFASPLPLLAGAAGELLWLLIGPRLPAFRAWVDGQLSAQYLARAETAIEGALAQLSEAEVTRFLTLSEDVARLASAAAERLSSREQQLALHGLLELRRTFLDYSFLGQRVASLRDPTPNAELEKEAAQLQESYSAERELTARMTIRQALGVVQRRMSQQTALAGVERSIQTRLEMLEKAVPYLRGRLADPGLVQLEPELDTALAEVGSAEALELAVDEIFDGPAPGATL